jgi:hypothetical protein
MDRIYLAVLRLRGARLNHSAAPGIESAVVHLYADLDDKEDLNEGDDRFVGAYKRPFETSHHLNNIDSGCIGFAVTDAVLARGGHRHRLSFTVAIMTPHSSLTWETAEVAVFAHES